MFPNQIYALTAQATRKIKICLIFKFYEWTINFKILKGIFLLSSSTWSTFKHPVEYAPK